jgi:hypothetical protein
MRQYLIACAVAIALCGGLFVACDAEKGQQTDYFQRVGGVK